MHFTSCLGERLCCFLSFFRAAWLFNSQLCGPRKDLGERRRRRMVVTNIWWLCLLSFLSSLAHFISQNPSLEKAFAGFDALSALIALDPCCSGVIIIKDTYQFENEAFLVHSRCHLWISTLTKWLFFFHSQIWSKRFWEIALGFKHQLMVRKKIISQVWRLGCTNQRNHHSSICKQ